MTVGAVGIKTTILCAYYYFKLSLLKKKGSHICAADAGKSSFPFEQFRNMLLKFNHTWKRQLVTAIGESHKWLPLLRAQQREGSHRSSF